MGHKKETAGEDLKFNDIKTSRNKVGDMITDELKALKEFDDVTYRHSLRVAQKCLLVGREFIDEPEDIIKLF